MRSGEAAPGFLVSGHYDAVLFDMDGVVTDTASIHASCWKATFDDFLRKRLAVVLSSLSISTLTTRSTWMASRAIKGSTTS